MKDIENNKGDVVFSLCTLFLCLCVLGSKLCEYMFMCILNGKFENLELFLCFFLLKHMYNKNTWR